MTDDHIARLMQAMDLSAMLSEQAESNASQWRAHLSGLLEVLDALDRALEPEPATNALRPIPAKTAGLIRKQLERCLVEVGVERIGCVGTPFDASLHHAVEVVPGAAADEDLIVAEVVAGYRWNGDLLRQPQVAVAQQSRASDGMPTHTKMPDED
jgi:molecular chaperone GrpE (heat shock protein)